MADELLYFNGVNASRGEYAREPLTVEALAGLIRGDSPEAARPERIDPDAELRQLLKQRVQLIESGSFEVKEGVDQADLAQTGWAVIFPAAPAGAADPYAAVREALTPLLRLRQAQAGGRYRECFGPTGYRPGEGRSEFLRRQGAATSGPVDPDRFPYYVLIVGSPEEIPFRFQYQLDVQYGVGRLHFAELREYGQYAQSVAAAAAGEVALARRAVFFATANPDDRATARAAAELAGPLAAALQGAPRAEGWQLETVRGAAATKARLGRLLGGPETPALLFTTSHGAEFDTVDSRQLRHQGALICQDWPGPAAWSHKALPDSFYFAGDDVGDDARLLGTVAFHFACFGAGTPRLDDFPHMRGGAQRAIAPHAFVSPLAQRLLGHPRGGALAVVGHVERAWTYSFSDKDGVRHLETFGSALRRLLFAGAPVGWALEFFNNRYAELATGLTDDLENIRWQNSPPDDATLAMRWTEHNDARSYVVLGDPAVRLPLVTAGVAAPAERVAIPEVTAGAKKETPMGSGETPQPQPQAPQPQAVPQVPQPQAVPQPGYVPGAVPQVPAGYIPAPIVIYPGYMPAPGSGPQPGAAGDSFGIGDLFRGGGEAVSDTVKQLTETLRGFTEKLAETLKATIEDAAHLEVETYVADDIATVAYRKGDFSGAELRAVTRMSLDGDTQVLVPERDGGGVDVELWAVHTSMVAQAQANRAEMIKAISQAAAGILAAIQGK
jgi:hypothetical protein